MAFNILLIITLQFFIIAIPALTQNAGRQIYKEVTINASVDDVWNAWTTVEGIKCHRALESVPFVGS